MRMKRTSKLGLRLLMSFEGFRSRATPLGDGRWVIGYGHTKSAREGAVVTQVDALSILRQYDLPPIEQLIEETVLAPLSQNEFDALVSLVFNIGSDAFRGSDVLAFLNSGEKLSAGEAITAWRKAKLNGRLIIVDALVRRRAAEKALFLRHPGGMPIAPSVHIRPQLDEKAARFIPSEPPVVATRERSAPKPEVIAVAPDAPQVADPIEPPIRHHVVPDIAGVTPDEGDLAPISEFHDLPELSDAETEDQPDVRQTAPELAAGQLVARLTRILGEPDGDGGPVPSRLDTEPLDDGPTPDEITRAISELADGPHAPEDDLPALPDMDDLSVENGDELPEATIVPKPPVMIDDLEPLGDPAAIVGANITEPPAKTGRSGLSWLIYVLLGVIGLVFAGVGIVGPSADFTGVNNGVGAFGYIAMTVLGGMLVALSLYFLVKAIIKGHEA
ncbi:MAG: glycoside hydrolase family protein [Hyphomonadaceae bacterium]